MRVFMAPSLVILSISDAMSIRLLYLMIEPCNNRLKELGTKITEDDLGCCYSPNIAYQQNKNWNKAGQASPARSLSTEPNNHTDVIVFSTCPLSYVQRHTI